MIYVESLISDDDQTVLSRQKNSLREKWYGLLLEYKDSEGEIVCADNEQWLLYKLFPLLQSKQYSSVGVEMNVFWDKKAMKQLKKLMREAISLGWFDGIENPYK